VVLSMETELIPKRKPQPRSIAKRVAHGDCIRPHGNQNLWMVMKQLDYDERQNTLSAKEGYIALVCLDSGHMTQVKYEEFEDMMEVEANDPIYRIKRIEAEEVE